MHQKQTAFENTVGKGEIARNEQISPFPTMLTTQSDNCIPICIYIFLSSLFAVELEEPKIGMQGKGFNSKVLDFFKFEVFDNKNLNVVKMVKFVFDRKENMEGEGENAG